MNEIFDGARQAADLIGRALGGAESFASMSARTDRLIVLPGMQPTEEEMQKFGDLVRSGWIYLSDQGLMMRVDRNVATGVNLRSGYYALGQARLENGLLYLARQYEGWEDPTGLSVEQREKAKPRKQPRI